MEFACASVVFEALGGFDERYIAHCLRYGGTRVQRGLERTIEHAVRAATGRRQYSPQKALSGEPRENPDACHDLGYGDQESMGAAQLYPYVVSQARSWGRTTLRDGSTRFSRSSLQRGWITSEEGRVLEDVFVNDAKQIIYFLGRPRMIEENGNEVAASTFQPLFHVRHAVGGSEEMPLNLWSIVLLTNASDPRYCEPFEQMVRAGLLPGFIEIYIERDLKLKLNRI